jgi:conjugative relaxase-like TrwC/TraI family protein
VTADPRKLSADRVDYYVREIARNYEEYLSGQGEAPGEYLGGGSKALGKAGVCSEEEFRRLFAWRHPDTGDRLGRAPRKDGMPAWDLVLRPVKDVAILYALGDDRARRAARGAHQAGVEAAVGYLDGQVGTRRGRDGAEHMCGQGLVVVGFAHRTSRAGDPLLHTHLVIVNRTQGPDGAWRTLDGRDLLHHRRAADAVYRAAYQHELTRTLGIRWGEADRWGNRAIVGMPPELVKAFSKRHAQITAELDRLEREEGKPRTAKLVQYVVHATRPAKTHQTPESLYAGWQAEARELGYDPERLLEQVCGRERVRSVLDPREPGSGGLPRSVRHAFTQLASPDGLTANASTFARRDVLVALGGRLAAVAPAELERLADRFVAEHAVSVVAERAVGERRSTTPELLTVEERLLAAAGSRAAEQVGVCPHEAVREALAAHPTIGADQEAMVRDVTQGGAGVAVVVGKPGTGKTYTLGAARHAWQLAGYRVVGAAPTGIATVCLQMEGFEEVATVDRLLGELATAGRRPARTASTGRDPDGPVLDARTMLVVDEAGMVGSRKLARLLDHAQGAGVKVVLVGDDRQLAAIEAGGGFRGLRLRLGASVLTENRRQQDQWQRQALEDMRTGDVDQAVAAYRAHGRLVAAETPTQLKQALVRDWWQAFQPTTRDPKQTVVILTRLRGEADQFNLACQQLRQQAGHLGAERLQVGDRSFVVGDLVVCGKNALQSLGVANATRGRIVALDVEHRTVTLDLGNGRQVTLPRQYLDERPRWWLRGNPDRRTLDLAYATTGHKAQGLTVERALVRVTGAEDGNWLHVQTSRAKRDTMLYAVVGPEPRDLELDGPPPPARTVDEQLAQGLRRDGGERLASDTTARLDLRQLSTHELRAERKRLAQVLAQAPPDRARLLAHTTRLREQAEQARAQAERDAEAARQHAAELGRGPAALLHRHQLAQARDRATLAATAAQLARGQAERATDRQREARYAQQHHLAWREGHAEDLAADRAVTRELAWQTRVAATAAEMDRPAWAAELGEPPTSLRGRRAYRHATRLLSDYRDRYQVADPDRALGPEPRGGDLELRRAHRACQEAIERLAGKQRAERDRTDRADPAKGDQRSAQEGRGARLHQPGRDGERHANRYRSTHERDAG